jgi:hypothetical protein
MTSRDEQFRPGSVEEQLTQLTSITPQSAERETPDARLVQDLRIIHADYTQSGERVWARLAEHLAEQNGVPNSLRLITNERLQTERSKHMQVEQFATQPISRVKPPRKPRRIFTLVASLLVAAVLVGSAAWAFAATHSSQQNPATAGHGKTQPGSPNSPSKTVPVGDCPRLSDPGWNVTCGEGLVQAINQSQKLSNGATLTLKGVYADHARIVIWYDVTPASSPTSIDDLTTQQGTTLPTQRDTRSETGGNYPSGHYQWIDEFDASSLPVSAQTVNLNLASDLIFADKSSVGQVTMVKASFSFNVMLGSIQLISPKQTVTANGIAITLSSVTISHVVTTFVLSAPNLPYQVSHGGFSCMLQPGRGEYSSKDGGSIYYRARTAGEAGSIIIGFQFTAHFNLTDQQDNSNWTFTVTSPNEEQPWVFHFTV